MAFRSEYREWHDELSSERPSRDWRLIGHVVSVIAGIACAVLLLVWEGSL